MRPFLVTFGQCILLGRATTSTDRCGFLYLAFAPPQNTTFANNILYTRIDKWSYNILFIRQDPFLLKRSDQKAQIHKCVVWSPKLKNNFGFHIGKPYIIRRPFKILDEATIEAKTSNGLCIIIGWSIWKTKLFLNSGDQTTHFCRCTFFSDHFNENLPSLIFITRVGLFFKDHACFFAIPVCRLYDKYNMLLNYTRSTTLKGLLYMESCFTVRFRSKNDPLVHLAKLPGNSQTAS